MYNLKINKQPLYFTGRHAKFFFSFFALFVQNAHKNAIFVDVETADCSHKRYFLNHY